MHSLRSAAKQLRYFLRYPSELLHPRRDEIVLTRDGIRMLCTFENYIERELLLHKVFESAGVDLLRGWLRPGQVVFDVGGNVGYYSLLFSKWVGATGQVHYFEPSQYAIERFRHNLGLNGELPVDNIRVNPTGLLAREQARWATIESQFSERRLAGRERRWIRFTSLDGYCSETAIQRIDLIKVDVDGWDHDVIRGGRRLLQERRPLLFCEFCAWALAARGDRIDAYVDTLLELGYDRCLVAGRQSFEATLGRLRSEGWFARYVSSNLLLLPSR
jgi:FkbM family methyltransferase